MTTRPAAPPASQLIRRAREARGLLPEDAADLLPAGVAIKGGRWRQIEQGYVAKKGDYIPAHGDDTLLAHMAHVVGVTPDRLAEAERPEAADTLREIRQQQTEAEDTFVAEVMREMPEFRETWDRLTPEQRARVAQKGEREKRRLEEQRARTREDFVTDVRSFIRPGEETAT